MTYRVLCDENVPETTVERLSEVGIETIHVTDEPGAGSGDARAAAFALEGDYLLLTNDDDFLNDTEFPDVSVLYYPDNGVEAHVLARRVEELVSLVPDPSDLGRVTFLTEG